MMSVCFTGHRNINFGKTRSVLRNTLSELIENGADTFYAGGASGFDTLAAQSVLSLKLKYPDIRLNLVLPCSAEEQTSSFTPQLKEIYYNILGQADNFELVSEHYTNYCMRQRNQRLIDLADVCVCCYDLRRPHTGTGQTVRMAEKKGIEIINIYTGELDY